MGAEVLGVPAVPAAPAAASLPSRPGMSQGTAEQENTVAFRAVPGVNGRGRKGTGTPRALSPLLRLPPALPASPVPRTERPGIAGDGFLIPSVPRGPRLAEPCCSAGSWQSLGQVTRAGSVPQRCPHPARTLGRGHGESPAPAAPPVLPQGRVWPCLGGAQRQLHHLEEKGPPSRAHRRQAQGCRRRVIRAAWS